jgi:hypothetical protein
MPYSPVKISQRFGETRYLHLLSRRISQARNQLRYIGYLLGLYFDPEDGGDVLLRNVC